MNQGVIKHNARGNMETSTLTGASIGVAVDLLRNYPENYRGWFYRALCMLFAILIFSPVVVDVMAWASGYYAFLGFLDPKRTPSIVPLVYCLTAMFSEPIISFLYKLFKVTLPNMVERRLNGRTDTETAE